MRIAIYSPYLDTAGGGERYMMTIAECLSSSAHVDVLLDSHLSEVGSQKIKEKIEKLHGIDLSKVNIINAPFGDDDFFVSRVLKRFVFLKKYNFLFYLTDGSIFYSTAKNNILHIQSPLKNTNSSLWGKLKLSCWKKIIYNSNFTKKEAEKSWPISGKVIYPPVPVERIKPLKKEKIILSVGRFFAIKGKNKNLYSSKNHKILIDGFRKLIAKGITDWSLHLAGGTGEGERSYLDGLKTHANGLPVYFHPDISFQELSSLYGKSSIYWHGAGYGESDPTKMEHFGISTVEAMAAGAVPVVINLGGQKEIVENNKSGYLWASPDVMVEKTFEVIRNRNLAEKLSKAAIKRSKIFSKERFCKEISNIVVDSRKT